MKTKLGLFIILLSIFYVGTADAQIKIFSGMTGGSYYEIATDIKNIYSPGTIEVKPSAGSLKNLESLTSGNCAIIQFDVLQNELLKDLTTGTSNVLDIRILLPLGIEVIHCITRDNQAVNVLNFEDLANRSVAVGLQNQGTNLTSGAIKQLTESSWVDKEISLKAAIPALLKNDIDAVFFVSMPPVKQLSIISSLPPQIQNSFKLLPIENPKLDQYYKNVVIKGGTYNWEESDIKTYGVYSVLITTIKDETPAQKEQLEKLLTEIKNDIETLRSDGHKIWKDVNFNFDDINWEPHKSAVKVFDLKIDD